MKILVTGCSLQQAGRPTTQGYQTVMSMHVEALKDLGHDVTWRPVTINDEDAMEHDLIIMGLVPFLSIAGNYIYPILNLWHNAEKTGKRVILSVDDWQYPRIADNCMTIARGIHRLTRETVFSGRPGWGWATGEGAPAVQALIERLLTSPWPDVIYPAFGWGKHCLLGLRLPAGRHIALDPTSYTRPYEVTQVHGDDRQRQWVLGALSDQSKWLSELQPGWQVMKAGRPRDGAPNLKEPQLVQEYASSWGVLSPHYTKVAGSGWWRNRFVYAAMVGAVLYADQSEVEPLGEPYLKTLQEIEALTTTELEELGQAQAKTLRENVWPRERYHSELEKLVRG